LLAVALVSLLGQRLERLIGASETALVCHPEGARAQSPALQ
jgi:hypothetical protein